MAKLSPPESPQIIIQSSAASIRFLSTKVSLSISCCVGIGLLVRKGQIERVLLDAIKAFGGVEVERGIAPTGLQIDEESLENPQAYPVRLTLRHLTEQEIAELPKVSVPAAGDFGINPGDEKELERRTTSKEGTEEVVHAKYVFGCDGARSWTRKQIGVTLAGEGKDPLWGAADVIPVTDFRK